MRWLSSAPVRWRAWGFLGLLSTLLVSGTAGAQTTDERILWCREYAAQLGVPAIAPDGTMYATSRGALHVIAPDGTPTARMTLRRHRLTTPVVGDQGMVYAMSDTILNESADYETDAASYLHAFDSTGTEVWRLQLLPEGRAVSPDAFSSGVVLSRNGDLLAGTSGDSMLYAVSPEGVLRWRFRGPSDIHGLGVGPDGTLCVLGRDAVYGVDPAGRLQWQWASDQPLGWAVAIDGNGSIYFASYSSGSLSAAVLYALSSKGQLRGRMRLEETPWIYSSPVIDSEGNVLLLEPGIGQMISILHAVTASGEPYWRLPLEADGQSAVVVGADETIYLVGQDGQHKVLYALDAIGGRERWQISFTNQVLGFTLSETGVLYLVQSYGASVYYLYAIQTDSPGLADSPWPMPRHDPRNTGRVSGPVTAVLETAREGLPTACRLGPSYPNPFNASTVVPFELPAAGPAEVRIYNVLGQEVALLAKGVFAAGRHQVRWEPQGQGSGVYFSRLQTPEGSAVRRMILAK
ncbi:MAG: PQQ-binding-like beta-propeller repeat protein [Candidatus Latescibacterota bacterium]|jgi:outer membrane protein assembly factor BamB